MTARPRTRARKREGRCYELSLQALLDLPPDTRWQLVHGFVNGPPSGHSRIGHAWLQQSGEVYDPVLDQFMTDTAYAAKFGAVAVNLYSPAKSAELSLREGHSGPWLERAVAIVGTSHKYQNPADPNAPAFLTFLAGVCRQSTFVLIAEEMSEDGLADMKAERSVCQQLAERLGIPHQLSDPGRQERQRLGVRDEHQLKLARWWGTEDLSDDQVAAITQEGYDIRERYWIDQLERADRWPVLFVCGANHVDGLTEKLIARNIRAEILDRDWMPTP